MEQTGAQQQCGEELEPLNMPPRNSRVGQTLGVFTSGGDAQGMNAAVRAVVRMAIYMGCEVYLIHEGYKGMVEGGDNIELANWFSVSSIIYRGGTIIGSARCLDFMERPGRLRAACNLIAHGISNLVAIGGDGTLTGAYILAQEWPDLLDELVAQGQFCMNLRNRYNTLNIVGVAGSIDNDFCGTDLTIGTNSAIHRIVESIDAIMSTAQSHQRTFVMEVMGRRCGYLAIVSGLVVAADYIFIPESPPPENWPELLCEKLKNVRAAGQRQNFVIIAEGACDLSGKPISSADVKAVIVERLQHDTRITVLGHVQRGGHPTAFDRLLASRMGAAAVVALMDATCDCNCKHDAVVIAIENNQIVRKSLTECVAQTQAVNTAMVGRNFELAVKLRGSRFRHCLEEFQLLSSVTPPEKDAHAPEGCGGYRLAVMHIGDPACGMNAAVRSFVRHGIYNKDVVLGICDGVVGLVAGHIKPLGWSDVIGWVSQGGAFLGVNNTMPEGQFDQIAERLKEFCVHGLLIIGGFNAYLAARQLMNERTSYPEFRIPIMVIPAAIENNLPGTEFSVGCDSSLNVITEICDRLQIAGQSVKQRVFVVETMGGYCGYLATIGALTCGADVAYIHEEKYSLKDLSNDIKHMISKMQEGVQRGIVMRNDHASDTYSSDFVRRIYAEEGKCTFSCRLNVLGYIQVGGVPTAFDRSFATKLGSKAVTWFHEQLDGRCGCKSSDAACLLGLAEGRYSFTSLKELEANTDFVYRRPKAQWWMRLRPLLKVLSKHPSAYKGTGSAAKPVDLDCKVN